MIGPLYDACSRLPESAVLFSTFVYQFACFLLWELCIPFCYSECVFYRYCPATYLEELCFRRGYSYVLWDHAVERKMNRPALRYTLFLPDTDQSRYHGTCCGVTVKR